MKRLFIIMYVALTSGMTPARSEAAPSLDETGFAWSATTIGDSCQILSGDQGDPLIFTFNTGIRYTFGSSPDCPAETTMDSPVRVYRIHHITAVPGMVTLVDQRGTTWFVLKQRRGIYTVRRAR
jgi:hypothetical protein